MKRLLFMGLFAIASACGKKADDTPVANSEPALPPPTPAVQSAKPAASGQVRDIAALIEATRQDASEGFRPDFNGDQYAQDSADMLATAAHSTNTAWAAYLTFLAGERHMKVTGSTYGMFNSRESAIEAFTISISSFPGALFPEDDPISGAPKDKPIEPYARLFLARLYSNWVEDDTLSPKNDRASENLEIIVNKFDDPSITLASRGEQPRSVLGSAMIGLFRIYGTSEKAIAIADKFSTKYPNLQFAWNGWWLGETRPEAYQLLASVEKDEKKQSTILMRIIEDYPKAWFGKAGSDDGGTYAMAAYAKLLELAKSDSQKIELYKQIVASKADKELKDEAMYALAENLQKSGDQAGAIKLYKAIVPKYLDIKPLNYDIQDAHTKAAHRMWEIEGKIKPGEYLQP